MSSVSGYQGVDQPPPHAGAPHTTTRRRSVSGGTCGTMMEWFGWSGSGFCDWFVFLRSLLIASLTVAVVILGVMVARGSKSSSSVSEAEIVQCLAVNRAWTPYRTEAVPLPPSSIYIKNATLWSAHWSGTVHGDMLLENGKIKDVYTLPPPSPPAGATVIDAQGRFVTPGLVDLHSHVGLHSWPDNDAINDVNEETDPIFPAVRALDALNPEDTAIAWIRSGGVTSSQVLPGSGNCMGGEGLLLKLKTTTTGHDMLIPNAPRLLKMATGENPKNVYGEGKGVTPGSRLGAAWLMRQAFDQTRDLMRRQRSWCATDANQRQGPFPDILMLNPLVGLLTGTARLHAHSYMVHDMEMLFRLMKEFNFQLSALHHGTETWRVGPLLRSLNITVANWADFWGRKIESYAQNVYGPSILEAQNVPVAIHSDHPAAGSVGRFLIYEAAKASRWGLTQRGALASVTSIPAAAMGIGNRVGSLIAGYDADVVVWDRDPMLLGAKPTRVIIDGQITFTNDIPLQSYPSSVVASTDIQETGPDYLYACGANKPVSRACYAVTGATIHPMIPTIDTVITNGMIVVENGSITCMGASGSCTIPASCLQYASPAGTTGVIIPGLVDIWSPIGTVDVLNRAGTPVNAGPTNSLYRAIDDIWVSPKHVRMAWAAGISTSVVPPQTSKALVRGVSVAFRTCCGNVIDDQVVNERTALHIQAGGAMGSNSADINVLRQLFAGAKALIDAGAIPTSPVDMMLPFVEVLQLKIPLVVNVIDVQHVSALIRLQAEFGYQMVVLGTESYSLAARFAAATPPIKAVVTARPNPSMPFSDKVNSESAATTFVRAGVPVALTLNSATAARLLRWEAGWIKEYGLTWNEALASVTRWPSDMMGLSNAGRISVGQKADFFFYNGDPLSLQAGPILGALGSYIHCNPVQPTE